MTTSYPIARYDQFGRDRTKLPGAAGYTFNNASSAGRTNYGSIGQLPYYTYNPTGGGAAAGAFSGVMANPRQFQNEEDMFMSSLTNFQRTSQRSGLPPLPPAPNVNAGQPTTKSPTLSPIPGVNNSLDAFSSPFPQEGAQQELAPVSAPTPNPAPQTGLGKPRSGTVTGTVTRGGKTYPVLKQPANTKDTFYKAGQAYQKIQNPKNTKETFYKAGKAYQKIQKPAPKMKRVVGGGWVPSN